MRAPPVTIACECGELAHVPYGDRWTCGRCGRTWNTAQIPADEYWGIMRQMRRFRLTAIAFAGGSSVVFVALGLLVSQALFLLLPAVLAFWYIWYMPMWRRKVRRSVRSLPKWNLHPE